MELYAQPLNVILATAMDNTLVVFVTRAILRFA